MPGRGLLGVLALQQRREAAAELDHLEPARDLAHRVGEHLAVLRRQQLRDLLATLVRRARGSAKKSSARFASDTARHVANACLRRLDGGVDLLDRREVDRAGLTAGRGVVDGAAAARLPGDAAPADPVADPLDARALLDGRGCELGHFAPPR